MIAKRALESKGKNRGHMVSVLFNLVFHVVLGPTQERAPIHKTFGDFI